MTPEELEAIAYLGSKEAGKQSNAYEKGHQLFGPEAASPWVRIELRYGNKLRVLSPDMRIAAARVRAQASRDSQWLTP